MEPLTHCGLEIRICLMLQQQGNEFDPPVLVHSIEKRSVFGLSTGGSEGRGQASIRKEEEGGKRMMMVMMILSLERCNGRILERWDHAWLPEASAECPSHLPELLDAKVSVGGAGGGRNRVRGVAALRL